MNTTNLTAHTYLLSVFYPKQTWQLLLVTKWPFVESHPTPSPLPSPHQTSGYRPGAGSFCCWDQDNASSFHAGRGERWGHTVCSSLRGELRLLLSVVQFIIVRSALMCNITPILPLAWWMWKSTTQYRHSFCRKRISHTEWSFHIMTSKLYAYF